MKLKKMSFFRKSTGLVTFLSNAITGEKLYAFTNSIINGKLGPHYRETENQRF